jgi:EmrB/QacA subfamily drug resistance transporter
MSSVAGPLLGGFFTDGPGWRWIFWINLPIGLISLLITSWALRIPVVRRQHKIDYLGAALIVAGVACFLLYLDWAGNELGWTAPGSLALLLGFIAITALFVLVEFRAAEPILPMRLFRNSVFSVGNAFTFLAGLAMFGGFIFLPVYLQAVQGMSPTRSGLALLPVVAGIFSTAISSGNIMTRTGRYKIFPILGAATMIVALGLMSRIGATTPYWQVAIFGFVFGAGLGFTMQTLVTAVQNAVDRSDMGTATSSTTFFRAMGASIGVAIMGAVLNNRLMTYLAEEFGGRAPTGGVNANNVQAIQQLPSPIKEHVLDAFSRALDAVFLTAIPFVAVALVVAFFLKEIPLATRASEEEPVAMGGI